MISGENAQAAGIDRQRIMHTEFSRKVSDRPSGQMRIFFREPHPARMQAAVKGFHHAVVAAQESWIGGGGFKFRRRDLAQELDRIVLRQLPERFVQSLKKRAGIWLPTPPEVISQLPQPADARR